MASFKTSALLTLNNEGGYTSGVGDYGGETYMGISRRWFPSWEGWAIIDELKKSVPIKQGACQLMDVSIPMKLYQSEFWAKIDGDHIMSQNVATQLFDHAVNASPGESVRLIQKILLVAVDGVIGPNTIARLNSEITSNLSSISRRIFQERIRAYLQESDKDQQQLANLPSWIHRTLVCYQG